MYEYRYPMQSVTADAVVICGDEVLLTKRNIAPFKGCYALPGGHLDEDDQDTEETAKRELYEEVGIREDDPNLVNIGFVGTYSAINRDPRGRYISSAYYFLFKEKPPLTIDPKEVQSAEWVSIDSLTKDDLAFDHFQIICDAAGVFLKFVFAPETKTDEYIQDMKAYPEKMRRKYAQTIMDSVEDVPMGQNQV